MKKIFLGGKYGSVIGNYAIVDDEDFEALNKFKWTAKRNYKTGRMYAERKVVDKHLSIHRQILELSDNKLEGDHINGNGLDNRRENLRVSTSQQNSFNARKNKNCKNKYKGVHAGKFGKYFARIGFNGRRIYLGYFDSEDEAAKTYNEAATRYFGDFANLNIIPTDDKNR